MALLALAGCEGVETDLRPSSLQPPFLVGDRVAQIDAGRGQMWIFGGADAPRALHAAVVELAGDAPTQVQVRASNVFALAGETLVVVGVTGEQPTRSIDVPSGFDTLEIDDDGAYAVLWSRQAPADSIFATPNRIALVDLADPPAVRTVALADTRPLGVSFAPPFTLEDPAVELRYAVIHAEGALSMVRLDDPREPDVQRIIPLAPPGAGDGVVPMSIVWSDDDPTDPFDVRMYVLAARAAELFAIDILPPASTDDRAFQPAINQIALRGTPLDVDRFDDGGRERLLVLSDGFLTVVDTATSQVAETTLPRRGYASSLVWQGDAGEPRALLWGAIDTGLFVELDLLGALGTGATRGVTFGRALSWVEPLEVGGARKALAYHASGAGIDVVNLDSRRAIALPATTDDLAFAVAGDLAYAVTPERARLVRIDLNTTSIDEVDIVAPGHRVFATATTVYVSHVDERQTSGSGFGFDPAPLPNTGWFTAYSAAAIGDGAIDERVGYAVEGVLDWRDQ